MKILLPYDGSKNAEDALNRLQSAGFGENHELRVLVADVFLPDTPDEFWRASADRRRKMLVSGNSSHVPARRRQEEEQFLLRELRGRVPEMFPSWKTRIEVLPGDSLASSEILEIARKFQPDVLVLGQKSVSATGAVENTAIGGGARRVAKEADCRIFFAGDDAKPFLEKIETSKKKHAPAVAALDKQMSLFARHGTVTKPKVLGALAAAAA